MRRKQMLPFEDARKLVRNLGLKSNRDWRRFRKTDGFSKLKIPSAPEIYYKNLGWNGFADWLNTKNLCSHNIIRPSFEDAKKIVRTLNVKNYNESLKIRTTEKYKSLNIPSNPNRFYKNKGWISSSDFFGYTTDRNKKRKHFINFDTARNIIRKKNIKNQQAWRSFTKTEEFKKLNIPVQPENIYEGWVSYGDWLGSGAISYKHCVFIPFKKARNIIRNKNLKNYKEWKSFIKTEEFRSLHIPSSPYKVYKEWKGLEDWIGSKRFLKFDEAKKIVKKLNIKNWEDWFRFTKTKEFKKFKIPTNPQCFYKNNGWIDSYDWFNKK